MRLRRVACVLATLVLAAGLCAPLAPREADARPGGGQGFSGGSKSSGGGSRSSGGSSGGSRSSGGSSRPSSDLSDSWSSKPSYSSPWVTDETKAPSKPASKPTRSNPHGGSFSLPRPQKPRGSVLEFFFWIAVGLGGVAVAGVVGARVINRRLEDWVVEGRHQHSAPSGLFEHLPELPGEVEEQTTQSFSDVRQALDALRSKDPDFSFVVFEDFAYALFAEVHRARGNGRISALSPYLADAAREWLRERQVREVSDVIVGGMRVEDVGIDPVSRRVRIALVFTANYTEKEDLSTSFYAEERWTLSRAADVPSRSPERARAIDCPNCGAALEQTIAGKCKYCDVETAGADLDWRVDEIESLAKEERGPILTGTTEEVGTEDPTLVADDARAALTALGKRDPSFHWNGFAARVEHIFQTFHRAWAAQDLAAARPYLSDVLFDVQRYWVETYKAQGLRNVTEQPRVITVHLSRVLSDTYFDAITVRVIAACIDYTLDASGKVVGGDREKFRNYSEYWTLIRGAGKQGEARTDSVCPNCGASLERINMAGKCGSCDIKLTLGAFDWVLSRIEQDEVFRL